MKEHIEENYKCYLIILFIAIIVTSGLLINGLPSGHDVDAHMARAVGTGEALSEGQFPPLVTSNFANGFGYSWNIFYPPLATYLMTILKIFLSTYANSLKQLIIIAVMIAGIGMYELLKEITKKNKISLLGSIMYMCAPYVLVDIYTRVALGEILSYAFFPILFLGIYNLINGNGKKHTLITVGAVGILLSHNISAVFAVVLSGIFVIFNINKLKDKKKIKKIIINVIFIVLITGFFYITLIQTKNSAEYVVFEYGKMGTLETLEENAVYLSQILFGKMQFGYSSILSDSNNIETDMCYQLGLFIIVPILFTPFVFKKIKKENRKNYILTLAIGILSIFAATNLFPYDKMPEWISFIQYPWRFLFIATFTLTIIATINIEKLFEKIDIKEIMVLTTIILIYISPLILANNFDSNITDEKYKEIDELIPNTRTTTATVSLEYIPTKAFLNIEYLRNRNQEVAVISGNVEITEQNKNGSSMEITYSKDEGKAIIELPYLYYPGYEIKVNGENIKYYETEKGFIGIDLENESNGEITVKYTGTTLARVSFIISIIGLIGFIIYNVVLIRKNKDKKEVIE